MRSLVVLPTFDEVENIGVVLPRIRAAAPDVDILVVDDASPDGTADVASALAAELGHISVLRRDTKHGLGRAYVAGFKEAISGGYDVVVEMDADLSHDPADLPRLLRAVADGADLAVGSRYIPGGSIPDWPVHRRALSKWGNRYAAAALRLPVHDATSGFRAYRVPLLAGLDLHHIRANGYCFQIELIYRVAQAGGTIAEVPIVFVDRERGESKMSGAIVVEALGLVTLWAARDRLGGRRRGRSRRARSHEAT